jgi:hypothetical protein
MATYFDFMQNIKNPFTGAIDAITDPVDEGGINIFGAGVNKEFEAMKTAGLLTDQQYKDAVEQADMRSKRSGIIQGLLGYGLQNFDKGYGSAFDPRYLKTGLASAIPAAQKPFDELAPNVMNIEKLKSFKRDTEKGAKVREILKKGFYKKTIGKDGKASFDVNYDIVDEVLKTTDVETAAQIQTMLSSKATLLNSMSNKYNIRYEGDRVFYSPKDGIGVIQEMTTKGLVPAKGGYQEKPTDDVPDIGELRAFNTQMHGYINRIGAKISHEDLKPITSGIYGDALYAYKNRSSEDKNKTLIDFGYERLKEKYKENPPNWWGNISYDPKLSESNQKQKVKETNFIIGNTYTSKNAMGEEFSAKFIGYDTTTGKPIFEDIK